jgi:hypothetical protein
MHIDKNLWKNKSSIKLTMNLAGYTLKNQIRNTMIGN